MGRRRYSSGKFPADTAPTNNNPGRPVDDVTLRMENIVVPRTTLDQQAAALAYLHRTGNADVADVLGLASVTGRKAGAAPAGASSPSTLQKGPDA